MTWPPGRAPGTGFPADSQTGSPARGRRAGADLRSTPGVSRTKVLIRRLSRGSHLFLPVGNLGLSRSTSCLTGSFPTPETTPARARVLHVNIGVITEDI